MTRHESAGASFKERSETAKRLISWVCMGWRGCGSGGGAEDFVRPLRQGGNIVTLKGLFSGGAVGQRVRYRGLYETIKTGENIVTLKAVFGCRLWGSG